MKTVITYGSFDMLHRGHINLLKRAKELGDFLIVGVTSEDFDISRGKINVEQSLAERMKGVSDTGYADLVIPEEYVGQKIDDIRSYGVDIFTVGSDWRGHFDYLEEYCSVIYLERTAGVSSTQIRQKANRVKLGIVGFPSNNLDKFVREASYVNGIEITAAYSKDKQIDSCLGNVVVFDDYSQMLSSVDAVYIANEPADHYDYCMQALEDGRHVLCESPVALSDHEADALFEMAKNKSVIFQEAIKTAYSQAFSRMVLLVKSQAIGKVRSVDATCTSLARRKSDFGSFIGWGPIAALGVFSILGSRYIKANAVRLLEEESSGGPRRKDLFTRVNLEYPNAIASITVGNGVKSEGCLVVSGTKGYIYVPSPWWKMDYFEVRYEDPEQNRRYFYQLDGEGIRFEIAAFSRSIVSGAMHSRCIPREVSVGIAKLVGDFSSNGLDVFTLGE